MIIGIPASLPSLSPSCPYQLHKIWEHIHFTNPYFLIPWKRRWENIVHSWSKRYIKLWSILYSTYVYSLTSIDCDILVSYLHFCFFNRKMSFLKIFSVISLLPVTRIVSVVLANWRSEIWISHAAQHGIISVILRNKWYPWQLWQRALWNRIMKMKMTITN